MITDSNAGKVDEAVRWFTGITTNTYNLYLIDEHSGDKVGEPYGVKLHESELAKYIPIMLNGLRVLKVANKVAGIVKSVFPFTYQQHPTKH